MIETTEELKCEQCGALVFNLFANVFANNQELVNWKWRCGRCGHWHIKKDETE
jgi:ribosomal protein S27AE